MQRDDENLWVDAAGIRDGVNYFGRARASLGGYRLTGADLAGASCRGGGDVHLDTLEAVNRRVGSSTLRDSGVQERLNLGDGHGAKVVENAVAND